MGFWSVYLLFLIFLDTVYYQEQIIAAQREKTQASPFLAFACIMLANISLNEAGHAALLNISGSGEWILPLVKGIIEGHWYREKLKTSINNA